MMDTVLIDVQDLEDLKYKETILDEIARCYEGADQILSTKEAAGIFLKVQQILKKGPKA